MYHLKYKKVDNNQIRIKSKVDSMMKLKVTVMPKEPLDNERWYRTAQTAARLAMMLRKVSFTYRNNYQMLLPGFTPNVGDAFGQKKVGTMAPGLDFAFGLVDDSYIGKARDNDWLLCNDSIATPATTSKTENLQLRATLEPVRDFKIDLSATRTMTTQKSIQYMYEGTPTTQSGTFPDDYHLAEFGFRGNRKCQQWLSQQDFREVCQLARWFPPAVESQYAGTVYPVGSTLGGGKYDASRTPVNPYSGDVMIPAFLNAYTSMGGSSLSIFPALSRLLPNWTVRYSGLGKLLGSASTSRV